MIAYGLPAKLARLRAILETPSEECPSGYRVGLVVERRDGAPPSETERRDMEARLRAWIIDAPDDGLKN